MLIKRGLGNEVFLKVKIWEIFTFTRRYSIDLLSNVNLRYVYPARYLHLLFLRYFHNSVYKTVSRILILNSSYRVPSVVAGAIECFHSRGQHLCKFIGTKESVCIRKEFNSHCTGLGHQHGRRFIVLGHQYGRCDVM